MNSTPYSKLARIYDKVMSHVDYSMWAIYINHILAGTGIKINNLVDLSCGTGKHLAEMKVKNLKIVGCDNSFPMLKMAQANLKNRKPLLINQDARHPAIREKSFDAAVMLYDSINYFFSEKEISILFTEIKYLLKDNGIFIFDFITQAGLKDCYKDYYESDSWDGLAYERHSWFSFADSIQHNEFIFLYNGKSYREVHKQKVRSVDEWATLVKKSDMKLISKFSNFTFQPASEKSERVHFICRII